MMTIAFQIWTQDRVIDISYTHLCKILNGLKCMISNYMTQGNNLLLAICFRRGCKQSMAGAMTTKHKQLSNVGYLTLVNPRLR